MDAKVARKDENRLTLRFDPTDPCQKLSLAVLKATNGRRKAQLIGVAITFLIKHGEAGVLATLAPLMSSEAARIIAPLRTITHEDVGGLTNEESIGKRTHQATESTARQMGKNTEHNGSTDALDAKQTNYECEASIESSGNQGEDDCSEDEEMRNAMLNALAMFGGEE